MMVSIHGNQNTVIINNINDIDRVNSIFKTFKIFFSPFYLTTFYDFCSHVYS